MERKIEMGKYAPLYEYLRAENDREEIALTLDQIESVLGFTLPDRARELRREWWTMHPANSQALSWLAAGRRPRCRPDGRVVFERSADRLGKTPDAHSVAIELNVQHARDELDTGPLGVLESPEQRRQWSPHEVYVLHFREAGLYKIGITPVGSGRPEGMCRRAGGIVVDRHVVANEWAAKVIEGDWLLRVHQHRVEPPLWLAQHAGVSEFWRDEVSPQPLDQYVTSLADDIARRHWSTSRPLDNQAA